MIICTMNLLSNNFKYAGNMNFPSDSYTVIYAAFFVFEIQFIYKALYSNQNETLFYNSSELKLYFAIGLFYILCILNISTFKLNVI